MGVIHIICYLGNKLQTLNYEGGWSSGPKKKDKIDKIADQFLEIKTVS